MAILEIIQYPDTRLKKKSKPVSSIDDNIRRLLDDMAETMYDAKGVGLAAPQVGKNIRAIVVDASRGDDYKEGSGLIQLINPSIVDYHGKQIGEEGCLSIPGFVAKVSRYDYVKVEALNRDGNPVVIEATGLLSRILQHEIDHLDGILFFERLSGLKKELLLKKINKAFLHHTVS